MTLEKYYKAKELIKSINQLENDLLEYYCGEKRCAIRMLAENESDCGKYIEMIKNEIESLRKEFENL